MAYSRKRRFRSRGRYVRRTGRRYGGRRLVSSIKRVIKRMSEVKYAVGRNAGDYDGNQGFQYLINPEIAIGAGKNQRIGQKIRYKRLTVRFQVAARMGTLPVSGTSTQTVRILLVQARVNNTGSSYPFFNWDDVFDDSGTNNSTVKNHNLRVLMDQIVDLGILNISNVATSTSMYMLKPSIRRFKLSVPINNNVEYRNASSTLPTDPKDMYYLLFYSNNGAPALAVTLYTSYTCRISYFDT